MAKKKAKAKRKTKKQRAKKAAAKKKKAAKKKSPAKKRARRKAAPKRARAAAPKPEGVAAGGPIEVPRANVGAAVQAAISFEKAVHVTAEAVDASAETFLVTWA